jgi:predicted transcriptional regulator
VSPDGNPTSSGVILLKSLKESALSPEEIAGKTGQPLFRVRSILRELENVEFVKQREGKYILSEAGENILR